MANQHRRSTRIIRNAVKQLKRKPARAGVESSTKVELGELRSRLDYVQQELGRLQNLNSPLSRGQTKQLLRLDRELMTLTDVLKGDQ